MDRDKLIRLVRRITEPSDDSDEYDLCSLEEEFANSVSHPGGEDLLNYPEHWGLPRDASAEQVVDAALSWVPRAIVMTIRQVRPHPDTDTLRCYEVVVDGAIRTQVVAAAGINRGDSVVIALSGSRLTNGDTVAHSFVGHAFSVGRLLERTDLPVGLDVTSTYCI